MELSFKLIILLGLLELLAGIVLYVRGQGEAMAGLQREDIARRTRMKRLALPLMAGGGTMAFFAAALLRMN